MNCHYVTRWITQEWEQAPGSLLYYDFRGNYIKRQYSNRLFADEGTNTSEIEGLISKYVESPLKGLLQQLISKSELVLDNWEQYRAGYLYFMIQSARYSKAMLTPEQRVAEEHHLDRLLLKGEDFLNGLVSIDMEKHQLLAISMPDNQILFFPEVGFYPFPVNDPGCLTEYTFGYILPITPFVALARVSKTADLKQLLGSRAQISGYSVGSGGNNHRVLIPKLLREQKTDQEIIDMFKAQREAAATVITSVEKIRGLVVDMYARAGLEVIVPPLISLPVILKE